MKKTLPYFLICSPLWLVPLICIPGVILYAIKGYSLFHGFSLLEVIEPLMRLNKFFYFVDVNESGYIERIFFGSVIGKSIRIGLWVVNLILIGFGVWSLKYMNRKSSIAFYSGCVAAFLSTITGSLIAFII